MSCLNVTRFLSFVDKGTAFWLEKFIIRALYIHNCVYDKDFFYYWLSEVTKLFTFEN